MWSSPTPFLLAAAIAAPSVIVSPVHSLAIKPSPPPHPPKSFSSRSSSSNLRPATRPGWHHHGSSDSNARQHQKHPSSTLRAYTVSENSKPSWTSFLNIPTSWDFGPKDSLFSFEAGGAMNIATRPLMPNLEVEAAAITSSATDANTGKDDDLLLELAALTESFEELQSSMDYKSQLHSEASKTYESKVESLEVKNALLEEGLSRMTATLELQDKKLREIQQVTEKELEVQDSMKALEGDNDMLRQRVRVLELELSEVAYESRKAAPAPPPVAVVAINHDVIEDGAISVAKPLSPKAPSVPVPAHIHQQSKLGQLQAQVKQYEQERASVRKLFSLGIRRSVQKVGKAINVWSPVHNLLLWGELRGN